MAKSARKPTITSVKKISSTSMKIKKKKDICASADVDKVMLTLKELLPVGDLMSSYDIMKETINYINSLNAMLSTVDDGQDICDLQSLFSQQAAVS